MYVYRSNNAWANAMSAYVVTSRTFRTYVIQLSANFVVLFN